MRMIAIVAASLFITGAAWAQSPATAPADAAGASCQSTIGPKNLHGAALASSAKKCCSDAATAAKLHGAAAASFTKKCVSDVAPPKS